jgi:hypothetical protein
MTRIFVAAVKPELRQCRRYVRMDKVIAFEQQRLAAMTRKRVGEAIAKVQLRGVAAALPEIAIGDNHLGKPFSS